MVSEFEIKILKANQNKQEHSLLIEQIDLCANEEDKSASITVSEIDLTD